MAQDFIFLAFVASAEAEEKISEGFDMKFDLEVGPETRAMESDTLPPIGEIIFAEDRSGKISLLVYAHERHVSGGEIRVLVRTNEILPSPKRTGERPPLALFPSPNDQSPHWADWHLSRMFGRD